MKTVQYLLAISLTLWVGLAIGTVAATDGVGVCVAGNGADFSDLGTDAGIGYTGVNVHSPAPVSQDVPATPVTNGFTLVAGAGPETAVYGDSASFEGACCAEGGLPADCFAPVG